MYWIYLKIQRSNGLQSHNYTKNKQMGIWIHYMQQIQIEEWLWLTADLFLVDVFDGGRYYKGHNLHSQTL